MAKTDDIIKEELTSVGNYKKLKMRGFVGSSNYDQELWVDGGLTFRSGGLVYGSCDFAWYRDEEWTEPSTGKKYNKRPIIAVEGTDCLNTKSYGTAQIQRFHHCFGSFLNGVISVYYLKKGKHPIRHDLLLGVYYANLVYDYKESKRAYLITDNLDDIKKLVRLVGDYGENSKNVYDFIDEILKHMKDLFNSFYTHTRNNYHSYEEYLNDRCIFKYGDTFIKFLGPKKESFLDSSIRYGHIVLGEAFITHFLLAGSGLIKQNQKFYYFFPLIDDEDYNLLISTMTHDKEFALLSNKNSFWDILTIDHISFSDPNIKANLLPFKELDLNVNRRAWNVVRKEISVSLKNNSFILK